MDSQTNKLSQEYERTKKECEEALRANRAGDLSDAAYKQLVRNLKERSREMGRALRAGGQIAPLFIWQERMAAVGYGTHPSADLFPLMDGIALAEFCVDIEEHGLQQPIVLSGEQIIDGRNRLRACQQVGMDPRFVEFESLGLNCSVEDYIWSANAQRRHLTADQRAAVAIAWKERIATEAKQRQQQSGGDRKSRKRQQKSVLANSPQPISQSVKTRQKLAQQAKVSEHKIKLAEKVHSARPELLEEVRTGKLPLAKAHKQVTEPQVVTLNPGQAAQEDWKKIGQIILRTLQKFAAGQDREYIRKLKIQSEQFFKKFAE